MKTTRRPFFLFIWFLVLSLHLQANEATDLFGEGLPSEQTEQELLDLSESLHSGDSPQLRARPSDTDEYDNPQKIPVGDVAFPQLFVLGIILSIYSIAIKQRKRRVRAKKMFFVPIAFFFIGIGVANAQTPVLKAVNDNYYLKPGGLYTLSVTINDDPGECANNINDLEVTIQNTPSTTGVTWSVISKNKIRVLVQATTRGSDVVQYTIKCPGNAATSSAKAYLNFSEKPDFVDDATCTVDPPETVWDIKKSLVSNYPVYYLANPLSGDLDGDGKPEIVTFGHQWSQKQVVDIHGSARNNSATVVVFDNQLKLKHVFGIMNTAKTDTVGADNYFGHPLALGDVDGDGKGEIVIGTGYADDYKLRCYTMNGTLKWVSHDKSGVELSYYAHPVSHKMFMGSATPVIADIDGDGKVEIFVGDRFFDGETGLLLATIPKGQVSVTTPLSPNLPTTYNWGRGYRHQTESIGGGTCQPVLADINGDGRLDAICGNATYDIKINRANPDLSTASLIAAVALPDGLTSVADINGDGILDVIVVTWGKVIPASLGWVYPYSPTVGIPTTVYAWDGATNRVYGLHQPKGKDGISSGGAGSRAFIGDIDGDGKPEICFTYVNMMAAYKYNGTNIVPIWSGKTTSDGSGSTTMTMFDFNLDGEAELVYRDETHIRILDKNGNNVKDNNGVDAIFNCYSGTHTEYPIVADLDGDGHAEIIVSGREIQTDPAQFETRLIAFTSKTPNVWAPARSVWNQHSYNPLWINEDLSVPRYPADPTNKAGHIDGSEQKPFNSFLQQAGWLNIEGKAFNKAPDLTFQLSKNQRLTYNDVTDQMTVRAFLTNVGSEVFSGDILLSLYTYTGATTSYFHVYSYAHTSKTIPIYGELELDIIIPNWSTIPFPAYDNLVLAINMTNNVPNAPKPFYKNQQECISWNNMTDKISYISGSVVMCQGDMAKLAISPAGAYDCYWYTLDGGGAKQPYPSAGNEIADSRIVTKQTSGTEFYLIDVYKKGTSSKISTVPDTLFVYQSADTLVWTGKLDKNWHNPNNWFNPNDPSGLNQHLNIPGSCTNVLLPSNDQQGLQIVRYPNLDSSDTDFNTYSSARCNNVHFDHGGEIQKVSDLTYSKAFVRLDIESNRWYCFSAPLRSLYSGDIYKTSGNPFDDGIFVFEKLFSQTHPNWGGTYIEGTWGRTFTNPTYAFRAGEGLGVWIDDGRPIETFMSQNFGFPKYDTHYYYYNEDGSILDGPLPIADRTLSHRFIFEETINPTTKDVLLQVEAKTAGSGKEILIGNPFMAHLDFDKFYAANSSKIEPYYRLIGSDGNYATYRIAGGSTGNPVLTANIAPMQSVLVTPKVPITASNYLVANGSMTVQSPGQKIRNTQESKTSFLQIFISDTELRNRASLIVDPGSKATTLFDEEEDVLKIITSGDILHPCIYLLSSDGRYADIKKIASLENTVFKLGFATDQTGPMAIGFEFKDIQEISAQVDVYLVDKVSNKEVLISQYQNIYCFEKTNTDRFNNDRFEVRFSKKGSSIEDVYEDDAKGVSFKTIDNTLFVMTSDNTSIIQDILIYDLEGRLIYSNKPNNSTISVSLPQGVFVVKATTNLQKTEIEKIIIR